MDLRILNSCFLQDMKKREHDVFSSTFFLALADQLIYILNKIRRYISASLLWEDCFGGELYQGILFFSLVGLSVLL